MPINPTPQPWGWFTDKVLPPLFAALTLGSITAGFATYNAVNTLTNKLEQIDKRVSILEARMETAVTQPQLLETMKRVELQLELMMARAGVKNAQFTHPNPNP